MNCFIFLTMSLHDMFTESHYWDNGPSRPYCGVLGHSFIRRLCRRWNEQSLYNNLTFSGEAYGTGGLSVTRLLEILQDSNLVKFDICFIQIGENDVKTSKELGLKNHELMHALVDIVKECRRQGVRKALFGSLFPRHHSGHNKRCNRLNKILKSIHTDKLWDHGPYFVYMYVTRVSR